MALLGGRTCELVDTLLKPRFTLACGLEAVTAAGATTPALDLRTLHAGGRQLAARSGEQLDRIRLAGVDREDGGSTGPERVGESFQRRALGRPRRRVLGAWVIWVLGEVEMVAVAAAAERGVAELARERVVSEHEATIHRQALRHVAGDRVAVDQRRVPVDCGRREEVSVQRRHDVPHPDGEPLLNGVDGDHAATLAVRHADPLVVALDDDEISDREPASQQAELRASERAGPPQQLASSPIEVGDVASPLGDHHRVALRAGSAPVGHELPARVVRSPGNMDAIVRDVGLDRVLRIAVAELVEGAPLPGFALSPVLGQLDGEPTPHEPADGAAGLELLQLAVIADQHELPVGLCDGIKQPGELTGREHAGLVDDEHRAVRERAVGALELGQERGDAGACNAAVCLELVRCTSRDGDPEHRTTGRLPRLARSDEGIRLPGTSLADDSGHARAAEAQVLDHRALVRSKGGSSRQRAPDRGIGRPASPRGMRRQSGVHDPLLEREQLGCRVDPLLRERQHSPVAAPERQPRLGIRLGRHERDDAIGCQETAGQRLQPGRAELEISW